MFNIFLLVFIRFQDIIIIHKHTHILKDVILFSMALLIAHVSASYNRTDHTFYYSWPKHNVHLLSVNMSFVAKKSIPCYIPHTKILAVWLVKSESRVVPPSIIARKEKCDALGSDSSFVFRWSKFCWKSYNAFSIFLRTREIKVRCTRKWKYFFVSLIAIQSIESQRIINLL